MIGSPLIPYSRSWYKQGCGKETAGLDESGIDEQTMELIKIRASQINHCAFCLDMHTQDAMAIGIGERLRKNRMYCVRPAKRRGARSL